MGENHAAPLRRALYGVVLLMAAIAYYILQNDNHGGARGPGSLLREALGRRLEGEALAGALPARHRDRVLASVDLVALYALVRADLARAGSPHRARAIAASQPLELGLDVRSI